VRAVALADFVSRDSGGAHPYPGKILFVRHRRLSGDITDPRVVDLAKFAFSKLGCKFAPGEIAKIAMRIIDARIFGNRKTPKVLIADDEFICSEFVAGAYDKAGLTIPWDGLGFVAHRQRRKPRPGRPGRCGPPAAPVRQEARKIAGAAAGDD
jgi:hypothetical protein